MDIDSLREALNDWALLIAGIFGVVAAWERAKRQIIRWWGNLNLWGRVHMLEEDMDEMHAMAHVHKGEAQP